MRLTLAWLLCAASGGHAATIWVLGEGQPPRGDALPPRALAEALRGEGDEVAVVSAADLQQRLTADTVDVLVMPGSAYPAIVRDALLAYLGSGGGLLAVGERPLSMATYEAGGTWRPLVQAPAEGAVAMPLGGWQVNQQTDAPEVSLTPAEGGSGLELHVPDGSAWYYARHDLKGLLTADHALLSFRAKGDGTYDWICLELNETDGSRWKAWVRAGREWRTYVIHTGDFLSYATQDRGGPEDFVHPERVSGLSIGGYRDLWGKGEHRLSIRDVAFAKCPVLGGRLQVLLPPERLRAGLRITDTGGALPVWLEEGTAALVYASATGARLVPLPQAEAGPPFGVAVLNYGGPFRGSRWSFLTGKRAAALLDSDAGRRQLREAAQYARSNRPLIADVRFDADAKPPHVEIIAKVRLVNPTKEATRVDVRAQFRAGDGGEAAVDASARSDLAPGKAQDVEVRFPWEGARPPLAYTASVALLCDGQEADRYATEMDPLSVLREAWDWLVSIQEPDGTLSSAYFVDAYAARALAGASRSDAKNARAYRAAALRWADGVVARQRDDGGWWVGYGPPDQEVYVADDGSIALGIACLYAEADPTRQAAYLKALRRYMAFRESFRNADGSLGIGYTKTDYFAKPLERFDEVKREMRGYPWTIGCSLGAAAALYAITGNQADKERAVRDARYLIANAGSTGLAHGYYSEALMLVSAWVDDEALKAEIEAALPGHFAATLYKPDYPFWSDSEGRNCLSLMPLALWSARAPEASAAAFRALSHLCRPDSPASLTGGIGEGRTLTIQVAFGACGVQEALGGLDTYPRRMPRASE